jgi:hypothetical protein
MTTKNKKPVGWLSERVFGPIALAAFFKRPQAVDQIGAYRCDILLL